jgi:ferredoxin
MRSAARSAHLRVDPVRCDGVGVCAHVATQIVRMDSWGYPIVPDEPLDSTGRRQAAVAVRACPRGALFIQLG